MTLYFFYAYDNKVMKKAARRKKESFFEKVEAEVVEAIVPSENKKMAHPLKRVLAKRSVQIGSFVGFAIITVAILVGYNWLSSGKGVSGLPSEKNIAEAEIKGLVEEVGDKIQLPNETPTLATVSDVAKLSGQQFFKNAQNGDKVLIFSNAKMAILYRVSIHKIIAVAPLNVPPDVAASQNNQTSSGSGNLTPAVTEKLKVVVLNSTKESGLAKKGAELLSEDFAEVLSTSNAQGEYDKTTVSGVSDRKIPDQDLKALVSVYSKVKPTITSLPTGEAVPAGADVVIILGSDFSEAY